MNKQLCFYRNMALVFLLMGGAIWGSAAFAQDTSTVLPNPANPPSKNPFDTEVLENNHQEMRAFINRVSAEQGIDRVVLQKLLQKAQWSQTALNYTQPRKSRPTQSRRRNWKAYRERFLTPRRLSSSMDFWLLHGETLKQAEKDYGVPASIIASILNIESRYGEHTGGFLSLDVIATLAFYHSTRREFFQKELAELIHLWRTGYIDILTLKGSYAGATGMGQFMPSSLSHYAVDYNGDGELNLNEPVDAIGSVANYLVKHGWQPHDQKGKISALDAVLQPIPIEGWEDKLPIKAWLKEGPKPTITKEVLVSSLNKAIEKANRSEQKKRFLSPLAPLTFPVLLVDLPTPNETKYRVGSMNYYVITRYNRSFNYATAVFDLARAIECGLVQESFVKSSDRNIHQGGLYSCLLL